MLGNDLLVRWTQNRSRSPVVRASAETNQHVAHRRDASGLFPPFDWVHGGHVQLDTASRVHFLADDRLDLAKRSIAQGQVGIRTRDDLPDQSRADHQLMRRYNRVRRRLFCRRDEECAPFHAGTHTTSLAVMQAGSVHFPDDAGTTLGLAENPVECSRLRWSPGERSCLRSRIIAAWRFTSIALPSQV